MAWYLRSSYLNLTYDPTHLFYLRPAYSLSFTSTNTLTRSLPTFLVWSCRSLAQIINSRLYIRFSKNKLHIHPYCLNLYIVPDCWSTLLSDTIIACSSNSGQLSKRHKSKRHNLAAQKHTATQQESRAVCRKSSLTWEWQLMESYHCC